MHRLGDDRRRELFDYWFSRGAGDTRVLTRATRGGPLRVWVPMLERYVWGCETPKLATARYVFSGHKYQQLIEALPIEQVALAGIRPAHLRYARERGIAAQSLFEGRSALARNFPEPRRPEQLDRAFDALVKALSGEPGRFLVLQTDSNPINRLLLFAAREAGMCTVCIQHGIFQSGSPPHIVDGWTADYMLVYDRYQRAVFADKGMAPERLPVLGFHERPAAEPPPPPGPARRVCVMGQPWANFHSDLEARYLAILRSVFGDLRAAGLDVVFKPHPREKGQHYLGEFGECFEGSMSEALARFEVCISITSTALLEATLAGRVAIQIHDEVFDADRFDEAGYAHTIDAADLTGLSALCLEAAPVDNPDLELLSPPELAARFVEVLGKLDPNAPPHRKPASRAPAIRVG